MSTTTAGGRSGQRVGGPAPAGVGDFDADRPYRISGSVSVRPESFGALIYDFHTRRLSFLKTRLLVHVVEALGDHPDVHGALDSAEVPPAQRDQYVTALAGLAQAGTITPRPHGETSP